MLGGIDMPSEGEEVEGFPCPLCGTPQKAFYYASYKRGWAFCTACGKFVRRTDIPEEYIVTVDDLSIVGGPPPPSPKPREEAEGMEEEGKESVWKTPPTPTDILREVLTEYGVKDRAKAIILRKSERMGGLHPNTVFSLLKDLDTGLPDKAIHHVVDDYYWALRKAEDEARKSGFEVSYPLEPYGERPEFMSYTFTRGYEPHYGRPYYQYERPPEYERRRFEESPRETVRYVTIDDLERILAEHDARRVEKERADRLEEYVYRELPEKIMSKVDEKISSSIEPIKNMISDLKSMIAEIRKQPEEPKNVITVEDFERILSKERDIQQKEFEKRMLELEMKYSRELSERERAQLENQIKELNRQIESLRDELDKTRTGRTAYDLAHEMIQAGKEIVKEDKPIRGIVREALGRPAQEKAPKRKESKTSELSIEELESLGIPYEEEEE
jgi:prefoldin subunit 5